MCIYGHSADFQSNFYPHKFLTASKLTEREIQRDQKVTRASCDSLTKGETTACYKWLAVHTGRQILGSTWFHFLQKYDLKKKN